MLPRRSSKLMLVPARGECSPAKPQRKRFLRLPVQGSTVVLGPTVFLLQSRGKKMCCLSRGGRATWTWHNIHSLNRICFRKLSLIYLFLPLPSPCPRRKKGKQTQAKCYPFCFLFLSFLSHCWDNCKRLYHWLATGYHFVRELYTEVEIQVELSNVFTFGSLSLEAQ